MSGDWGGFRVGRRGDDGPVVRAIPVGLGWSVRLRGIGLGLRVALPAGRTSSFERGEGAVEVAVVACAVAAELGEDARAVGEVAVAEGVAVGDGTVVGPGSRGVGSRLGRLEAERFRRGDVGVVQQAGLEDGDAVAPPECGDHFVDEDGFDGPDRLEFAVYAAAAADEILAVLAGEKNGVGQVPVAGGILGTDSLALGRARSGGFLGVPAVGFYSAFREHGGSSGGEYGIGGAAEWGILRVNC